MSVEQDTHMATEERTGTCECGATVTRIDPTADVRFAALVRDRPFRCDPCLAAEEERWTAEEEAERRTQQRHNYERRLADSGLPAKYHGRNLGDLDQPVSLLDQCRSWIKNGRGLLLTGQFGTGKTTLAGAAVARMLADRMVCWTTAPLLFARLGSGLDSEQRREAVSILTAKVALAIDDIDKVRPTEYAAEQVFLAVDQRVEHELPLLVTSNLDAGELAAKWPDPFGPAIASRLIGYCQIVNVPGQDRRLRAVQG